MESEEILKQFMLECRTNGSSKYYEVTLTLLNDRYHVSARYGKRVGRWKVEGGTVVDKGRSRYLSNQERIFNDIVRSKRAKGYVIIENKKPEPKKVKKEKTMDDQSLERFSFVASEL